MNFHIITIFPESFDSYFSSSIMKKAQDKKLFSINFYKLNDFSKSASKRVDDKAYGMHWQVIEAEVLSEAIEFNTCNLLNSKLKTFKSRRDWIFLWKFRKWLYNHLWTLWRYWSKNYRFVCWLSS